MRRVTVVAIIVLLLTAQPGYACPTEVHNTYYSDYFQTAVGGNSNHCDCSSESWGTQDGAYLYHERMSCNSGGSTAKCYEKLNGNWVEISCPF